VTQPNWTLANMNFGAMVEDCTADSQRWFPGKTQSVAFMTLAMMGEAGEVANIVKKIERGSSRLNDPAVKEHLTEEIVDVLIYLCNMIGLPEFADVDWGQVWDAKRRFNEDRFGPVKHDNHVHKPRALPDQVLAEAGLDVEVKQQTWQTPGEFAS